MAKVTAARADVVFVLELTEPEARYVHAALWRSNPTEFGSDVVWDALDEAMTEAGIKTDSAASTGA